MAEPLTPRLPGQPPPLPPLPLRPVTATDQQLAANAGAMPFDPRMAEPFPPAEERAPDTLRLGSPLPRATMLPPPPDPLTESTGQLLRQELALVREVLREALPTQPGLPPPAWPAKPGVPDDPQVLAAFAGPGSLRTRSRAAVAALTAGKYGGVVLLGGIALRALAKVWPASGHTIEAILQALGL